jgi:hypothetical protein
VLLRVLQVLQVQAPLAVPGAAPALLLPLCPPLRLRLCC